jgi:hypothetical protein
LQRGESIFDADGLGKHVFCAGWLGYGTACLSV